MNFLKEWMNNEKYFQLLELMARLSNLYSDSQTPFLHYRVTENLFCKYYEADNISRADAAYDAKKDTLGIGIKTFILKNNASLEKVAEFNNISNQLKNYSGKDLAYQIAKARNDRIECGRRVYSIENECYHIVGRVPEGLTVFNTPYRLINLNKINSVVDKGNVLRFEDDNDIYSFNYSKSTLYKKFLVPKEKKDIAVSIIQDPYEILRKLIDTEDYEGKYQDIYNVHQIIYEQTHNPQIQLKYGYNYIILPLYSERYHMVPTKSGLNQWNAAGRDRDPNEVYIPIPISVHKLYPNFFPSRDAPFKLKLPNGVTLSAKICQDNGKALMSNPNLALGKWILRDVLQLKEGELLTLDLLNRLGFNSVKIIKQDEKHYSIDVYMKSEQGNEDE